MAGPGGREVGRISIRALPDTSNFSTSLQAYLDRIERRAQVKIKVVPDFDGFTTEIRERLERVRASVAVPVRPDTAGFAQRVRDELASTSARVRVPVEPDTTGFQAQLRAAVAAPSAQVRVPVVPDTTGFLSRVRADLNQISLTSRQVQITPDLTGFRAALRAALAPMRQSFEVQIVPRIMGFRRDLRVALDGIEPEVSVRLAVHASEIARLRRELATITPPITIPARVDIQRGTVTALRERLAGLASIGGGSGGNGSANWIARLAAAAVTATPQVASLVVALGQIAPAAAVGATGMIALTSTVAALKIGAMGVGDALKYAFDPEQAEKFNKAMAKLTPNARAFVLALKGAQPQFKAFREAVQERLFDKLGEQITSAGRVALPVLQKGLVGTAGALNGMGRGVLTAARDLAQSGALGKAMAGANKGLTNLQKLPGQFIAGLTRIAVAASPAFDRLTKAAGDASTRVTERISRGLESGKLTDAIDTAIDKAKELGTVVGNVGKILGNVFGPAADAGGDFLGVLKSVTGELAKVTATSGVQDALKAVFESLATVGKTAAGLLGDALTAIAPAVVALSGPVQTLVKSLADGLRPIITALSPILETLAASAGRVVAAFAPLLAVAGELIGGVLKAAEPLIRGLGEQLALLAESAMSLLGPALKQLPPLIQPLLDTFGQLATIWLDIQNKILKALQPAFVALGEALGKVVAALQPLVAAFAVFVQEGLAAMMPILDPIIVGVGELAALLAGGLARAITEVVVPAIQAVTALLKGDFSLAWDKAREATSNAVDLIDLAMQKLPILIGQIMTRVKEGLKQKAIEAMVSLQQRFGDGVRRAEIQLAMLPGKASNALSTLGTRLGARANTEMVQLRTAVGLKIAETIVKIGELPGRAASALSGLGGTLRSAGAQLINGMIQGVSERANALASRAREVVNGAIAAAKNALGIHSPSRVFAEIGKYTIAGFIKGIDGSSAKLRQRLEALAKQIPSTTKSGLARSLRKSTGELGKLVTKRDKVIKNLAAAEKRLKDVTKARSDISKSVREGILSGADITTESRAGATAGGITERLKKDLAAARKFASDIASLRKRGLRADLLGQLGEAGVEGGAAAAKALANASDAELKEINRLQKELVKTAGKTGTTVADAMYKNGVQAAQGVVEGLKKSKKSIEQVMIDIAKGMQKAIRKALGIKSPARKLIPVGVQSVLGVVRGLDKERPTLEAAMRSLVPIPSLAGIPSSGLTVEPAAANSDEPFELTGPLTLSSGEFLGYLSGAFARRDGAVVSAARARRKR